MLLLFGVVAFLYFMVNPTKVTFFPKCPLFVTTGVYCPGCGSQRAAHSLLNFNIFEALQQNVLFVIGLLFLAYQIVIKGLNIFFNTHFKSVLNHPKLPIIFIIIAVVFWILRNLPLYPFNLLAPH